ncbi:uncharacterized protein LOC128884974 [Hylaeus volcanicus]|uniref:uncharacterized protein LOC128884974 n=1 Tax=Hylaeus volcanicus TaxID=313075 RepID=UPI0023B7E3E8|nr:uncharacterized protein LOC128884974 [Hylaeus volcanicus]
MSDCRPAYTPLEPGIKLTKEDCPANEKDREEMINVPYCELISSLMYVARNTRSDIAYAVTKLAQFSSNAGKVHWTEAKRILRYLSKTSDLGLKYEKGAATLEMWTDADWAGDIDDRHSFSGTPVTIGGNLVDWKTSKQKCISTSTMEAEYVALSTVAKEAS